MGKEHTHSTIANIPCSIYFNDGGVVDNDNNNNNNTLGTFTGHRHHRHRELAAEKNTHPCP